jgi:phage terminase large subunit-like protein
VPKYKKEDAQEILWRRGVLKWKLRDYQVKLYSAISECERNRYVVNCARRWGKSFVMSLLAVERAIQGNSSTRIKIATATAKNLEEFIIPAFRILLDDCPSDLWEGWKDGYLRSKKKFIFQNGSEIQLIGLDKDPDGGRGNYVDLYIIDEAGFVRNLPYLISSVISPMMLGREGARLYIISTPSSTPAHPFQDVCAKAIAGGYYSEYNIFDNTSITKEEAERIHEEDCETESDWLREYMCQHVVDENLAIIPEWDAKYETAPERPSYYNFLHRYVGMDLGVKHDLTALLFGYWDPKKHVLIIEDEAHINGPKMTTIALKDLIVNKEQNLWRDLPAPYRRISDNDNPLLLQDLGSLHNMYFISTGKDELHAMVNEVRELIKAGKLYVHPRCRMLIGNLRAGIWNDKRRSFERNATYGHFDHLAALVYLVRNLDRYTDPVPNLIGVHDKTHHINERKKQVRNEAEIKKMLNLTYKK